MANNLRSELAEYLRNYSAPLTHLNAKLSKSEQTIRDLDQARLTLAESAKDISEKTGLNYGTCFKYLSSFRMGVHDKIYADFLARQKGFVTFCEEMLYNTAKSKNSTISIDEFREETVKKRGFNSTEDYVRFLEDKRLFFHKDFIKSRNLCQKKFEYANLEFHDPEDIYLIPEEKANWLNEEDRAYFWNVLGSILEKQEFSVLYLRFVEDKTLAETGNLLGVTGERVRVLENDILKNKLGHRSKKRILRDFLP